jgi:GAF domain-containing protein
VSEERLRDAVAASALSGERAHADLLQSVVDVARAIFEAKAASITLYDEDADELVFEAVSGEGSESLVGNRFPSTQGIAGWVLRSREPLVMDDVTQDPRFAKDVAEDTGYVPKGMMVAPLLRGDGAVGVLSVLDRPAERPFTLTEMDLLVMFARQAAIAIEVVQRARTAGLALSNEGEASTVADLARAVDALEGERREAALRLLAALDELIG